MPRVGAQGPFLAGYEPVASQEVSYGIQRLDHAVGNVPDLLETVKYIMRATGFHEFAEFTAEVRIMWESLLVLTPTYTSSQETC